MSIVRKLMMGGNMNEISSVEELKFKSTFVTSPNLSTIPAAIIIGVVCGLLGAGFIFFNTRINKVRKTIVTKNWQRVVEVALFSLATSSVFYWGPYLFNQCKSNDLVSDDNLDLLSQYNCEDGHHSPLATTFFNEEVGAIRSIMSGFDGPGGIRLPAEQLVLYLLAWYIFMTITYGVFIPAGLFLPGIIIGCAVGAIYEELNQKMFSQEDKSYSDAVVPVLLGVGAMLSAYCRMTYSLAVVMMETTASINIFVPMFTAIMVARVVAGFFSPSLYVKTIRVKGIPVLPKHAPAEARHIVLGDIMRPNVDCLSTISTVDQII